MTQGHYVCPAIICFLWFYRHSPLINVADNQLAFSQALKTYFLFHNVNRHLFTHIKKWVMPLLSLVDESSTCSEAALCVCVCVCLGWDWRLGEHVSSFSITEQSVACQLSLPHCILTMQIYANDVSLLDSSPQARASWMGYSFERKLLLNGADDLNERTE